MHRFTLPVEFDGDTPDLHAGDILLPPEMLEINGYVFIERIGSDRVQLLSVKPEDRWEHDGILYQVDRVEEWGGYRLRQVAPGGVHPISLQAMRRIRGHGVTVSPSEAFGLLVGWPEQREILAALPVGRTRTYHQRSDLFAGIADALPPARELVAPLGLSVMGVYCASRCRDFWDIGFRLPSCMADGYLLIAPAHGCAWDADMLSRPSPPHGRQCCPWRISHRRIETAKLNPRRIHSAWIKRVGPVDYGRCEESTAAPSDTPAPADAPASDDWFTAARSTLDPATLPPEWQWLGPAIATAAEVRVRYGGGTTPGAERTIRPVSIFRVAGYDATYVQAIDLEIDSERVFRLDRMCR